jgi:SAM-dependent methyltransferase
MKEIFTKIYNDNIWGSKETASGTGSELNATIPLRLRLPILFKKYNIRTILDVGCGDCNWISKTIYDFDYYLGIDIVDEIIAKNNKLYKSDKVEFKQGNVCDINFDKFDVVIIADVLAHLSFSDILRALEKIKKVKYVFITNYPTFAANFDIETGSWRPVNFLIEPFNFKKPIETIDYNDLYDIKLRQCNDKTLSLWNGI